MKKRGFTLIELLAVIVVLAIIALIATPIVLNIINEAKKGAAEQSAVTYIHSVENYMVLSELNPDKYSVKLERGKSYQISEDLFEYGFNDNFKFIESVYADSETDVVANVYLNDFIEYNGKLPVKGIVSIGNDNKVSAATMAIDGYMADCTENKCKIVGKSDITVVGVESVTINDKSVTSLGIGGTLNLTATVLPDNTSNKKLLWTSSDESIATVDVDGKVTGISPGKTIITVRAGGKTDSIELTTYKIYQNGETVYFNPTTGKKCEDYVSTNSNFGVVTGCQRFYAFLDDGGDTLNLIIDHNTMNSKWEGQTMINNLKNNVSSWHGVDIRTDSYSFSNTNVSYTLDYSGSRARIISAEEVKKITGLSSWKNTNTSECSYFDSNSSSPGTCKTKSTSGCNYYWLHQYIHNNETYCYGCTSTTVANATTSGYWTSDVATSTVSWQVGYNGSLRRYSNTKVTYIGIRPVITVRKDQLV